MVEQGGLLRKPHQHQQEAGPIRRCGRSLESSAANAEEAAAGRDEGAVHDPRELAGEARVLGRGPREVYAEARTQP